ncbi:uncharacterized protein LOC135483318 [Lineus longissimus]|uniref:uncharacterized protein LOC135483318 n=1 Tax=Lineus longissimus TaxID=88925 RepID=UPI00315CA01F
MKRSRAAKIRPAPSSTNTLVSDQNISNEDATASARPGSGSGRVLDQTPESAKPEDSQQTKSPAGVSFDVDVRKFTEKSAVCETSDNDGCEDSSVTAKPGVVDDYEALFRNDDDDGIAGGEDDVDFGKNVDFHVVTKYMNIPDMKQDEEEYQRQMMEKVRVEYLPYFVGKFANLKPGEVEEFSFVKTDTKFENIVTELHNLFNTQVRTQDNYKFTTELYKILASFDSLFYAFRKLLEILFQNNLSDDGFNEPHYIFKPSITFMTMCLMLNAADANRDFARKLCQEPGLLELFVWLLRQVKDKHLTKTNMNKSGETVLENSLNILYNCSMHDENRQRLLEVGGLEACLPYLDSHVDDNQGFAFLCVAYLANEEQSEIFKAKRDLIYRLVEFLKCAIPEPTRRYIGWAAVELAKGLDTLSRNDTNKKLIIDCGAIDVLLLGAFLQDAPDVQEESMLVLWTLSFDIAAKTLLKQNQEAMELFDKIVSTVPKHRCRKAAKGILWNLRDAEMHNPTEEPSQRPHIMVSYQWDAKPLVLKVRDALRAAGYKVWVDVDNMEGSTINAMAEAVENSTVVLMCMSHRYKESQNCRSEAEYAYTRRKEIIPLVVETQYKPDGWLGFIKGAKMYYDITNKATFEEKMKQLMKALGLKGMSSDPAARQVPVPLKVTETRAPGSSPAPGGRALRNWDQNQVAEWMKQCCISGERVSDLNGRQLHFLQRMLQRAPEYYYSFVERNLHRLNEFADFTALTNALEDMLDNEPTHSSHF